MLLRKPLTALLAFFFTAGAVFSFSPQDIHTYTLENGLRLSVLSDTSSATVRLELDVYAGYSVQTERTAGYIPLYARLLSQALGGAEAGADALRMVRTVAPRDVEQALVTLSGALRPLSVTDGELGRALAAMKSEVTDYAASAAGFINTAIDARVFSAAPWKQESGVYPALFTAATVQSARTVLDRVAASFYTAPNAALFISGNITPEEAIALSQRAFSGVRATPVPAPAHPAAGQSAVAGQGAAGEQASANPAPVGRKFLLSDDAFSQDMVQIVVQYLDFTRDQADLLAAALNDDRSAFKAALTGAASLGIRGAEYVNAASAQKRGSSRLIIQSLLEKTKASPCAQAEDFLRIVEDAAYLDDRALSAARAQFDRGFFQRQDDSAALMELFAACCASYDGSFEPEAFFDRAGSLSAFTAAELCTVQRLQSPYVFVLVNSAVYKKRAADFKKAGYQLVTAKNGSWYSQALYQALLEEEGEEHPAGGGDSYARDAAGRYISRNLEQLSGLSLANGIPVTVKQEAGSTVSLMLTIAGGELLFTEKTPGLCALLTDALALSMRRHIAAPCTVTAETFASFSRICITCASADLAECVRGAGYALIYSDISPAMADGIAYDERTQWRLKTGTAGFQLVCEAARTVYGSSYGKLYNDKEDKPASSLDFTRIASSYPLLLDSSRYSLVLVGALPDSGLLQPLLNEHFGVLESRAATESKGKTLPEARLPKKTKSVKLRHLFLTDVSADKAGPRPQVLVPTKDFYDPLLYCLPAPDLSSTDSALFQALLLEFARRLQEKCGDALPVGLSPADDDLAFARITVSNVVRTRQVDALYAAVVRELKDDLEALVMQGPGKAQAGEADGEEEKSPLLASLENQWIMQVLGEAGSAEGRARLLGSGFMRAKDPALYLRQYEAVSRAGAQDYYLLAQAYLDEAAPFRLYSADSKK